MVFRRVQSALCVFPGFGSDLQSLFQSDTGAAVDEYNPHYSRRLPVPPHLALSVGLAQQVENFPRPGSRDYVQFFQSGLGSDSGLYPGPRAKGGCLFTYAKIENLIEGLACHPSNTMGNCYWSDLYARGSLGFHCELELAYV